MSALPPKADIESVGWNVRVPMTNIKRTSFYPLGPIIRCQPGIKRRRLCTRRLQLTKRYPRCGTPETITIWLDSERLLARHDGTNETLLKCNAFGIAITL